jgi:hypothetical protein
MGKPRAPTGAGAGDRTSSGAAVLLGLLRRSLGLVEGV